jgi:hypothetical protein
MRLALLFTSYTKVAMLTYQNNIPHSVSQYSVLLMYYYLRTVHFYVTLPPGIGPIAVGNKHII